MEQKIPAIKEIACSNGFSTACNKFCCFYFRYRLKRPDAQGLTGITVPDNPGRTAGTRPLPCPPSPACSRERLNIQTEWRENTAFLYVAPSLCNPRRHYNLPGAIDPVVLATFDGTTVRTGKDGKSLYEQSGYGRPDGDGLRLSPQEALYLLHRQKIEVPEYTFDTLFSEFADQPNFTRSFLVYHDLRERGYVVQTGPHDFRVFRRGEKPGKGESLYLVRVLSERDPVRFGTLIGEVVASGNMRKQYVLAVVDDEDELTYYEIKLQKLADACTTLPALSRHDAVLVGKSAMVGTPAGSDLELAGYGKRLDPERLLLAPVELLYLMGRGIITLTRGTETLSPEEFLTMAGETDRELAVKIAVYEKLRSHDYTPRTGYKFGHHFRVYCKKSVHSELLVHAVEKDAELPMSVISRSVRMAHSVKKKMFFGTVHSSGIQFIEFARIKL
jgi:tRNA-intron endonuclease